MNPPFSETHTRPRLNQPPATTPAWTALAALQQAANRTALDPRLLELVKLRASQINRCAFCIELHVRTAAALGERNDRLHLLQSWEEVSLFSARERAALRWTEAVTRLADGPIPDAVFAEVSAQFDEKELLELTLAIIAINGWNRVNVAFRVPPDPNFWPGGKPRTHDAVASSGRGAVLSAANA